MPIYEFRCDKCGRRFEKLCSMGENGAHIKCPSCSAPTPSRVMSGFCKQSSDDPLSSGGGCSGCSSGNCTTCGH